MLPGIMFRNIYVLLVTVGIAVFTGIWLLTHFWNRLNPTSEPADDRQEEDSLPEKRTFAWSLFFVVFLLSALGHGLIGLAIIQVRLIWSVVGLLGIWFVLGAISRYHLHKPGRSACLLNLMISLLISLGLIGFCIAFWETAYPLFVIPLSFLACLGGAVLSEDLLDALEQESEVGESNPELTSQSVPAATPASLPAEPSDRVAHTPEHRAVHTETDSSLSDPDLEISRLEMQIKGPATAMAVVAVLGYLFMLAILAGKAYLTFDHGRIENQLFELALFAVAILLILLATATILFGAFQMRRLEHYEWCLTAGILAMIPWTGPVYLISLPVGIWAFRTLRRPDVREAFLTKAVERQQLAQQASTNELDRQANLLFTTSIINWIGLPVGLAIATVAILLTGDEKLIRDKDTWPILFIVIPGWFVPANAALTVAALKLKRREWYWFSLAGCLLAGVIPPGLFLGLPVGVWTFILICSSKVRGEFSQESSAKNQADASGTSTDASTATTNQKATGKYLLIACLTVIPLAIVIVIVVWLLMQRPADPGTFSNEVMSRMDAVESHDSTLHEAAESGDVARVIKLLDAGANVNDKDVDGQTPLMRAAANGHSALCQTLMVLGASANERDNQKRTAFMLAAENGHSGVIAAFFELEYIGRHVSAKSEVRGLNLDWRLLKKYDLDAELSDHFPIDVDAQDDKGETALMKAAARGDLVTLQALHNGDTAVDETLRDNRGFTPLMHAVINGHTTLIRNLADPLYKQYSSPPPNQTIPRVSLSGKVAINSPSCYLELENLRLVDNDGRTALQLAEALGEDEISKLLRRHLDTLIANATDVIEQGGPLTKEAYRYRGIAYQILGEQEKAESDFKRSEQPGE